VKTGRFGRQAARSGGPSNLQLPCLAMEGVGGWRSPGTGRGAAGFWSGPTPGALHDRPHPCGIRLFKIHFVTVDIAVEAALDFAVGFIDDRLHGFVVGEHLGGEAADAVAPRDAHEVLELEGADAVILPLVPGWSSDRDNSCRRR
jgi:hypothetical protein